nr:DUF4402 domain-containing protein [uncultured Sphingomonas sp.]
MGRTIAPICLAALAVIGVCAPARSQEIEAPCQLCANKAASTVQGQSTPLTIRVDTSLVFDRLILAGAGSGTAELRPDGSVRTTGSVGSIGQRAVVGEVTIEGEPGRFVRVSLPQAISLYGYSGGTIRVEAIESDLGAMPKLDEQGRLTFRFGGVVRVDGDLDGDFRGDLPIDVEYF